MYLTGEICCCIFKPFLAYKCLETLIKEDMIMMLLVKGMTETLKFIKAVFGTVFGMINVVYHDKPLMFIGVTFGRSSFPILGQ